MAEFIQALVAPGTTSMIPWLTTMFGEPEMGLFKMVGDHDLYPAVVEISIMEDRARRIGVKTMSTDTEMAKAAAAMRYIHDVVVAKGYVRAGEMSGYRVYTRE